MTLTNADLNTNPTNDNTQLITARVDTDDPMRHHILVTGVSAGYALLEVKMETPGGATISASIQLTVVVVSSFQKLQVSMDVMDDQTASDLFGVIASRDFYIARIRMFNNLAKDPNTNFAGDSLLAYSSSIETGIKLEKRYDRRLGTYIAPQKICP